MPSQSDWARADPSNANRRRLGLAALLAATLVGSAEHEDSTEEETWASEEVLDSPSDSQTDFLITIDYDDTEDGTSDEPASPYWDGPLYVCSLFPGLDFPCYPERPNSFAEDAHLWLRHYYKHRLSPRWATRAIVTLCATELGTRAPQHTTTLPGYLPRKGTPEENLGGVEAAKSLYFITGAAWALLQESRAEQAGVGEIIEWFRQDCREILSELDIGQMGPVALALWLCSSPDCQNSFETLSQSAGWLASMKGVPPYPSIEAVPLALDDAELKFELLYGYFAVTGSPKAIQRMIDFISLTHRQQLESDSDKLIWIAHQRLRVAFAALALRHKLIRDFVSGRLASQPFFHDDLTKAIIVDLVNHVQSKIDQAKEWNELTPILPEGIQQQ